MASRIAFIDIELGNIGSTNSSAQSPRERLLLALLIQFARGVSSLTSLCRRRITQLKIWIKRWIKRSAMVRGSKRQVKVEDYRRGYPRFSALMASHGSFHVFRRFETLRVRLLLLKQDKLSFLEKKLDRIDNDDPSPLFLACNRMDKNVERAAVISEIESVLDTYDDLMERSGKMLSFDSPLPMHVSSLENWLEGNGCIAREETGFLGRENDLLTVGPLDDGILHWLEMIVSTSLAFLNKGHQRNRSNDQHVHIFPRTFTDKVARVLLAPLVVFLLLGPVVICNAISSPNGRLIIFLLAAVTFITTLSLLTKSKTIDLAAASATYLTVLIAFINNPSR